MKEIVKLYGKLMRILVYGCLFLGSLEVRAGEQKVFYLHTDHLETPRVVTDEQNKVVWRNSPLAESFGQGAVDEDPDGDGTRFTLNLRFPGQYYDIETNTHYNYYRDYDPQTGRYIQSDPIGLAGGINTYSYVAGNPLSITDPRGLDNPGMGPYGGRDPYPVAPSGHPGYVPIFDPPQCPATCNKPALASCVLDEGLSGGLPCILCAVSRGKNKSACRECTGTGGAALKCIPDNCSLNSSD